MVQQLTECFTINKMTEVVCTVHYHIYSLNITNNPLFTRLRTILLHSGTRKVIASVRHHSNDTTVLFDSQLEENCVLKKQGSNYGQNRVVIVIQFEAEGRFIKLGETNIDIGQIASGNKNGQLVVYQIQKCYDRSAKISVGVTIEEIGSSYEGISGKDRKRLRIRSRQVEEGKRMVPVPFTPKQRPQRPQLRTRPINNRTQYCQQQDTLKQYSLISEAIPTKHPATSKASNMNYRNAFRKQIEMTEESYELVEVKSNLKLTQQQLHRIQMKYSELQMVCDQLQEEQRQAIRVNQNMKEQYESKLRATQRSGTVNNKTSTEKYMSLYQESEESRNKLLVQLQQFHLSNGDHKEQLRLLQTKLRQEQNRCQMATRSVEQYREEIKASRKETMEMKKAYEKERKGRLKLKEQIDRINKQTQKYKLSMNQSNEQMKRCRRQIQDYKNKGTDQSQQLQLCKFNISELERQILVLKQNNERQSEVAAIVQQQLQLANQTIKADKARYAQRLHELEQLAEQNQANMGSYIEQLQTNIVQLTLRANEGVAAKGELARLRDELEEKKDKIRVLQDEKTGMITERKQKEERQRQEQRALMKISQEKSILQIKIKQLQGTLAGKEGKQDESRMREEQEHLLRQCESKRDQFWQKQIQKLEGQTLTLIERWGQQKSELSQSLSKCERQLSEKDAEIAKLSQKIQQYEVQTHKDKHIRQQMEGNLKKTKDSLEEAERESKRKNIQIQHISHKLNIKQQEYDSYLQQSQRKLSLKDKDLANVRMAIDKQKGYSKQLKQELKELFIYLVGLLETPESQKVVCEQIRGQFIETQIMLMLKKALGSYCQRHNRVRDKIARSQELRRQLSKKQEEITRIEAALREQKNKQSLRSSSITQSDVSFSYAKKQNKDSDSKLLLTKIQDQKDKSEALRHENQQLKLKIQYQLSRIDGLEEQIQKLSNKYQNCKKQEKILQEDIDRKAAELRESSVMLITKEKQLKMIRQDLQQLSNQLNQTKIKNEELTRIIQYQKSQTSLKKNNVLNRSKPDEPLFKVMELQKKLSFAQEEIDRLKRQKEQRKKEEQPLHKQVKILELKIKEKEAAIIQIGKQLQEEKDQRSKQKEYFITQAKKTKADHDEQISQHISSQKQMADKIKEQQQKSRVLQKNIKKLEGEIKKLNEQIFDATHKEEKARKLLQNDCELKIKSMMTDHRKQQEVIRRLLEEQKSVQKSLRDTVAKKQKDIVKLQHEIEKKDMKIEEILAQMEVCGFRLKNYEQQEGQYKETIGQLEKKIKFDTFSQSDKNLNSNSVFSLKNYAFK